MSAALNGLWCEDQRVFGLVLEDDCDEVVMTILPLFVFYVLIICPNTQFEYIFECCFFFFLAMSIIFIYLFI